MDDELGRVAYTAYCQRQAWKSYSGDQLPSWENVRLDIRLAWIAAAVTAVEHWRIYGARTVQIGLEEIKASAPPYGQKVEEPGP